MMNEESNNTVHAYVASKTISTVPPLNTLDLSCATSVTHWSERIPMASSTLLLLQDCWIHRRLLHKIDMFVARSISRKLWTIH